MTQSQPCKPKPSGELGEGNGAISLSDAWLCRSLWRTGVDDLAEKEVEKEGVSVVSTYLSLFQIVLIGLCQILCCTVFILSCILPVFSFYLPF